MKIEVINTGSELLHGQIVNTSLSWIGGRLSDLGLRIDRQTTVPDGPEIKEAMCESMRRADLVIVTGGLGPTSDDITRDVAAELLGRKLIFHPAIMERIESYFALRGSAPHPLAKAQAMVPEGATVLPNDFGTAPGLLLEHDKKALILLPGPPRELKPMWDASVAPWLEKRAKREFYERTWRIIGVGETRVQELLEEPLKDLGKFSIGYCSRTGEVDFRLTAEDRASLERADKFIRSQLGENVYAEGEETMEQVVVRLATEKRKTITTAESCTGGLLGQRLSRVPGASAVYAGSWTTYKNELKMAELGVPESMLREHGAVSEPVARAMAEGALRKSRADIAVSTTGMAGPEPGTKEKPAGLLYMAVATLEGVETLKKNLPIDRDSYQYSASQIGLDQVRRVLMRNK